MNNKTKPAQILWQHIIWTCTSTYYYTMNSSSSFFGMETANHCSNVCQCLLCLNSFSQNFIHCTTCVLVCVCVRHSICKKKTNPVSMLCGSTHRACTFWRWSFVYQFPTTNAIYTVEITLHPTPADLTHALTFWKTATVYSMNKLQINKDMNKTTAQILPQYKPLTAGMKHF